MRILLITPPMVQFNTPYPATPQLTAFLRRQGFDVHQADLSLELALRLFSRRGLGEVLAELRGSKRRPTASVASFLGQADRYLATADGVLRYLQRGEPALASRMAVGKLPVGPRFRVLDELARVGVDPEAGDPEAYPRFLASLYLDDLADAIREGIDPRFGMCRYAERLGASAPSFAPLRRALGAAPGLLDRMLEELTDRWLKRVRPSLVGVTIPFPGNVYAAFRIAQRVKAWNPDVSTVAGGGYVNTELRSLTDPRVFDFFDFVAYDDGEIPLLRLAEHLAGRAPRESLVRTRMRAGRTVVSVDSGGPELRHRERPAPCYDGLALDRYCGVTETLNPMSRLWTERRWMKLALAHGCYWRRCAFCDTGLDYIARYDPADPKTIVGWIEEVVERTGERGFHFVDEAAAPALLRGVADELRRRGLRIEWWTNIRFDRAFTPELVRRLARAGCVAVAGGLECAEERLLSTMNKGVTLAQAARVARAFADEGVLVHAYLMYGFPGQGAQETVDGLEFVRQLFRAGLLHSAFWHRFALTVHSPACRCAGQFGLRPAALPHGGFAENEVPFREVRRTRPAEFAPPLQAAVYNYMHGTGLDEDVRVWFSRRVPRPRLSPTAVADWAG